MMLSRLHKRRRQDHEAQVQEKSTWRERVQPRNAVPVRQAAGWQCEGSVLHPSSHEGDCTGTTQLSLPSHLRAWAERKAEIADANLKEEFFHIQAQMATIIRHEVQMKGAIFHSNIAPSNGEIEVHLKSLRDTRPFMTKEGCRPFPSRVRTIEQFMLYMAVV